MKKYMILIILCAVILVSFGTIVIFNNGVETELQNSLQSLKMKYPEAFGSIQNKYGNNINFEKIGRSGVHIIIVCNNEFENKYRYADESKEDFLQRISDDLFGCFTNEILENINNNDNYFSWPVSIGFVIDTEYKYEYVGFVYEDFSNCRIVYRDEY